MLMIYLPLVIARWIHFASVFVLFGSSFFWFYERAERSLAGPGGLPRAVRATNILLRIAAPVAAVSGVAWLACILINMARDFHSIIDPEDIRLFFFETPFGTVSILRLALLAIGVVIAFLRWHGRWRFAALVPVTAMLLITQAWFGHSVDGKGLYRASMMTIYGITRSPRRPGRAGFRRSLSAHRAMPLRAFGKSTPQHARYLLPLLLNGDGGGHLGCHKRHRQRGLSCRRTLPQALRQQLWRCAA